MTEGTKAYVVVILVALVARGTLSFFDVVYINRGQALLWSWMFAPLLVLAIAMGALLAKGSRIPEPLASGITRAQRFGWPALAGVAIAAAIIASDIIAPVGSVHIPFPAAIPFYTYGAILIYALFHFLPLAAIDRIAVRLRSRAANIIAPAAVALLAFSEDGGYFLRSGMPATMESARHGISVVANAAELAVTWRFGFLAGLTLRGATYVCWHLLWPLVSDA
jgi:hypothetical protein